MKINKSILIAFFSILLTGSVFAQTQPKTILTEKDVDKMVDKNTITTPNLAKTSLEQTSNIETVTEDGTYIEGEMVVEREMERGGDMDEKVTIKYDGEKQNGAEVEGLIKMETTIDRNDKIKREVVIKEEVASKTGRDVETTMESKTVIKDNGKMKTDIETKTEVETADGDDYKTKSKSSKEVNVDAKTTKRMIRQKN